MANWKIVNKDRYHKPAVTMALIAITVTGCAGPVQTTKSRTDQIPAAGKYTLAGDGLIKLIEPASGLQQDDQLVHLANRQPKTLFETALANAANIKDYRCKMIRAEKHGLNIAAAEHIEVTFMVEPFSVYMNWAKNARKAEKLLYIDGENDGKMLVMPVLVGWLTGPMKIDPAGKQARQSSRRPVTQFGFEKMLQRMYRPYQTGQLTIGGTFKDHLIGPVTVDGQEAIAIERIRTGGPAVEADQAVGWVICLDSDKLMPIAVSEFDQLDRLLGDYVFTDIEYNIGLTEDDFNPETLGLAKK